MNKLWQIIKYEYTRHVFKKRFILSVLGMPLFLLFVTGVAMLAGFLMMDKSPIGYVDQSGTLNAGLTKKDKGSIFEPVLEMMKYSSPETAAEALNQEEIQAYLILPENFAKTREAQVFFAGELSSEASNHIDAFLRENLVANESLPSKTRLSEGTTYLLKSADDSREIRENEWLKFVMPFIIGIVFIIAVMTSGGYLLQALVEEKENRTMEVMITSVSPLQLMAGKIIGNLSVGLTQLLIWGIMIWLGLTIAGRFIPEIADLDLSFSTILVNLLTLLPAFVLVSAMMAALGATVSDMREAQQVSGFFTLPIFFPYYFVTSIMLNPDGLIARLLSFFPLSAPVALSMRMAFGTVPSWEITSIILIMFGFSAIMIWLAARAFRIGMLSYGKKISLRRVFAREVKNV